MKMRDLQDLLKKEMDDLYSSEKQLTRALPKMARAASSSKLTAAFEEHLAQTEAHVERLEQAYERLGMRPGRKKCEAMEGLLKEGEELIKSGSEPDVLDAALIGAAQRVEHYEIAGYGCARTYARLLGEDEVAAAFQTTLDEEGQTDKRLTRLAERGINVEAMDQRSNDQRSNGARRSGGQPAKAGGKAESKTKTKAKAKAGAGGKASR
jgi:ferritin-like metal-binding protein YciE